MSAEPHVPAREPAAPEPAAPGADLPSPPRIVVPPEVAEAVRAAGYASLVAEDGRPLLRVREETEEDCRRLARQLVPDEEVRAIVAEFRAELAAGGRTYTWEEILAGLPDERPAAEAA